jgi:tetratricopeptide (TPR) repeat protein
MKWIGIAAALLSFGTAVYGVLHAQADMRERSRVVSEQLAAGRLEQAAGDYPGAMQSLEKARAAADEDGLFAKLLGGLGRQRQTVRAAQEDLAMEWARAAHAPEGHTFSETTDKLVGILSAGANGSSGARKADLLAHLGWAYFLRQRDGDALRPDLQYREATAADPDNPYANAFWGHYILWSNGELTAAKARFAAALATPRARATVRQFQLAALENSRSDTLEAEWWRVINEMHKSGEPLSVHILQEMASRDYFALQDDKNLTRLIAAVGPDDQAELQRTILASEALDAGDRLNAQAVLAVALEASGNREEALAAWREANSLTHGNAEHSLTPRVNAAIKRLSPR